MGNKKWFSGILALILAAGCMAVPSRAAQVDAGAVYCFQAEDFLEAAQQEQGMTGVFITAVPEDGQGLVCLGSRAIQPGDFLTAAQLNALTFQARQDGANETQLRYLPICGRQVEPEAVLTISITKKENTPPQADDSTFETYKNLENKGTLKARDPEGDLLTYTLVKEPKRGDVVLHADGSFTYTPKHNKVGTDSFTYTCTDSRGQTSREATVTVEIMKPLLANTYRDVTTGLFEAMWMENTGLYSGCEVAGERCFGPQEPVSRGDFLAMAMKLLEVPVDKDLTESGFVDTQEAAQWLRPYLSAAMRLGIAAGSNQDGQVVFRPNDPITEAEAAVLLDNILKLPVDGTLQTSAPQWAQGAVQAMSGAGIQLSRPNEALTRLEAARLLYQVSKIASTAPGLAVFGKH